MPRLHLATLALLLGSSASFAKDTCDSIRDRIDAKIRASGVTSFALSVLDVDAKTDGKTVGSCDLGTKKIIYHPPSPAAARPAVKPAEQRIVTECKDGTVTLGGDCK